MGDGLPPKGGLAMVLVEDVQRAYSVRAEGARRPNVGLAVVECWVSVG